MKIIEAITDPAVPDTLTWYDNSYGEICDMCYGTDTVNGHTIQQWFSQQGGMCVTTHVDTSTATTCSGSTPVDCHNGFCCPDTYTCASGGSCNPPTTCPTGFPIPCTGFCCPTGSICGTNSCLALTHDQGCPVGYDVNCNNGYCCKAGQTCNTTNIGYCYTNNTGSSGCPTNYPVDCLNGYCCDNGTVCNTNGGTTTCDPPQYGGCPTGFDVDCMNGYCCQTGFVCGGQGIKSAYLCCPASDPVNCNDGYCCPAGYVCATGNLCNPNVTSGSTGPTSGPTTKTSGSTGPTTSPGTTTSRSTTSSPSNTNTKDNASVANVLLPFFIIISFGLFVLT